MFLFGFIDLLFSLLCWPQLPNGDTIKIGRERFEAAEALFNPILVDCAQPGIAHLIFNMINDASMDLRRAVSEGGKV